MPRTFPVYNRQWSKPFDSGLCSFRNDYPLLLKNALYYAKKRNQTPLVMRSSVGNSGFGSVISYSDVSKDMGILCMHDSSVSCAVRVLFDHDLHICYWGFGYIKANFFHYSGISIIYDEDFGTLNTECGCLVYTIDTIERFLRSYTFDEYVVKTIDCDEFDSRCVEADEKVNCLELPEDIREAIWYAMLPEWLANGVPALTESELAAQVALIESWKKFAREKKMFREGEHWVVRDKATL